MRIAAFSAVVLIAVPALAQEFAPGCNADLAAIDASFVETQERLDGWADADQSERCGRIRHHIEVMENGVGVFMRCLPEGHDQRENVLQLQVSIADFLYIADEQGCE